jgi:hypothetical protein
MRGQKSTLEEKLQKGTANQTREKAKAEKAATTNPDVTGYLAKTKEILDNLWNKINEKDIPIKDLEKYSRLFIMYQKHYFTYSNLLPKEIKSDDVISKLINEKEL